MDLKHLDDLLGPPSSQVKTVKLELRSLDAYFYILFTMSGGCHFSSGQAFGTSQSSVGFESKREDALSNLGQGL